MGFRSLLTTRFNLSSAELTWREPAFFRVRLRNDLLLRLLVVLGAWLGSAGLLLMVFSVNVDPPGIGLALALGLIGAGIGYVLVLGRRNHVSGSCWMYERTIFWQSTSAGFLAIQGNVAEWDYEAIIECHVVPPKFTGSSFSVMLIDDQDDRTMIGIPDSIEPGQVARLLREKGVEVSMAKKVPKDFTAGLSPAVSLPAVLIGLTLLSVGWFMSPEDAERPNRREVAQPDIPGFPDLPGPQAVHVPGIGVPVDSVPGTPPAPHNDEIGTNSERLGGEGGIPFRTASPEGQPVVAVRFAMGVWAGKERVRELVPMFERPGLADPEISVAQEGYALGAMEVSANDLVDAVRLVFMRLREDGSLDEDDSYKSDWIGNPIEDNIRTLTGNGRPVIGLYGRGAAVMDAIGLVMK